MPNWCVTDFTFVGSRKDIEVFKSVLDRYTATSRVKNGFGDKWLGNIVICEGENHNKIHCRGEITYIEDIYEDPDNKENAIFELQTWTAWEPCFTVFNLVLRRFPSIKYYFYSEEPGGELYLTNDPEMNYFDLEQDRINHGYLAFTEGERPTDDWKEEDLACVN